MGQRLSNTLKKVITILTAVAFAATAASASDSANTFGYSAQGISMGNAMTAIVSDWTSVWYNPAGLGKTEDGKPGFKKPESSMSLKKTKTDSAKETFPNEFAISALYTISSLKINGLSQEVKDEALNSLDFGMITVGLTLDLNMIYEMPEFISSSRMGIGATVGMDGSAMKINDVDPRTPDFIRYGREAQRAIILAGAGFGFLKDMFGVGVCINATFSGSGQMKLDDVLMEPDSQYPLSQTKMDLSIRPTINAGLYFSPGKITSVLEGLEIGTSYRMESYVAIDPLDAEATTLIFKMGLPMKTAIFDYYSPHIITAGLAYKLPVPVVPITIAFDFEYQLWSQFKVSSTADRVLDEKNIAIPDMKNIPVFRVGIEIIPALTWMKVQTGYYYQPSFIPDQISSTVTNYLDNDKHVASLGFVFIIPPFLGLKGPLEISTGYQIQIMPEKNGYYIEETKTTSYTYGGINNLVTFSMSVKV